MKTNKPIIGEAVRDVRKLRGMTQRDLAKASELSPNTIAMVERGERDLSSKSLNRVGKALRVPASCLAVLGTPNPGKKDELNSRLLEQMSRLILSTIQLEEEANSERRRPSKKRRAAS